MGAIIDADVRERSRRRALRSARGKEQGTGKNSRKGLAAETRGIKRRGCNLDSRFSYRDIAHLYDSEIQS